MKLSNIVDNKRVILIGRSSKLLHPIEHKHQGEFIDSHDVVIRTNNPHPYPYSNTNDSFEIGKSHFVHPHLQHLLGSRVDAFYINHVQHELTIPLLPSLVHNGCKLVGNAKPKEKRHLMVTRVWEQYISQIQKQIEYYTVTLEVFQSLIAQYKKYIALKEILPTRGIDPTMGGIIIQELLNTNLKQLHLIGFTCFSSYYEQKKVWGGYVHKRNVNHHNPLIELCWLQDLCKSDRRLKPDKTLQSIFEYNSYYR